MKSNITIPKVANEFYTDLTRYVSYAFTQYIAEISDEIPEVVKDLGFDNMLMQVTSRFAALELGAFFIEHSTMTKKGEEELIEAFTENFKQFITIVLNAQRIKDKH